VQTSIGMLRGCAPARRRHTVRGLGRPKWARLIAGTDLAPYGTESSTPVMASRLCDMECRCSHAVARFGVPKPSAGVDQISSRRPVAVSGASRRRLPSFAPVIGAPHPVEASTVSVVCSCGSAGVRGGCRSTVFPLPPIQACASPSAIAFWRRVASRICTDWWMVSDLQWWNRGALGRLEVMTDLLLMACTPGNQVCFWLRR
jgi:hypothetical protein